MKGSWRGASKRGWKRAALRLLVRFVRVSRVFVHLPAIVCSMALIAGIAVTFLVCHISWFFSFLVRLEFNEAFDYSY